MNAGRRLILRSHMLNLYYLLLSSKKILVSLLTAWEIVVHFPLCSRWTTSGLKSQGRLSVGSSRDREISMSVGLGRSQLDSRGGVVGGTIDVNTLEMVGKLESCLYSYMLQTINVKT